MGKNPEPPIDVASSLLAALWRPRPLWLLLLMGICIGFAHTATLLPLSLAIGAGRFWEFPAGTIGGSFNDLAGPYVGYLYFVQGPWTWPLLLTRELIPPHGTNIFWLDAIPWLALLGKAVATSTGWVANLYAPYLFGCFVLPGVAMVWLLWVAGQRNLLAAIVGATLTCAAPFMVVEWGHPALSSQYLIVLALGLYLLSMQAPRRSGVAVGWLVVLVMALLTNMYLFVMVGGLWFAAWAQRGLDGAAPLSRLAVEAVACVGGVLVVMIVTGILGTELQAAASDGFGFHSMNLGSPFLPQMSGVIPPLARYLIGTRSQVFAFIGLGALLAGVAALPFAVGRLPATMRAHSVLICVLAGFVLLALSHRIMLGSRVIVLIPLPEWLVHALGAFRASGRFFWPVGYAIVAFSLLTILRIARRRTATVLLLLVAVLQVIDLGPTRAVIAASAQAPLPPVVDRAQLADILARARGVVVLPSSSCQGTPDDDQAIMRRAQATMEIQLIAARQRLPINSTYTARMLTDCTEEKTSRGLPLRPGVAYFYVHGAPAAEAQLNGHDRARVCGALDGVSYCLLPEAGNDR